MTRRWSTIRLRAWRNILKDGSKTLIPNFRAMLWEEAFNLITAEAYDLNQMNGMIRALPVTVKAAQQEYMNRKPGRGR